MWRRRRLEYQGILFTSEGKMEREMGQADCCGISSSADSVPDRCGEEGTELEGKAFQIYQSIYALTSSYCHELWAVTERISKIILIHKDKMRFLMQLILRAGVRNLDIRRELGKEPLLICVRWSQPRRFGIWLGCLLGACLWRFSGHAQLGRDPMADLAGGITYFTGPGTPQNPSGGPEKHCRLVYPA